MATYHFISHTHWDREWYLPFETFRAMLVRMMDDTMDLLDVRSEFRAFTLDGQSVLLEDYTTIRPERAKKLRALGKAGRLFAGPWYVLPDEFLVSGESLVRNLMIGSSIARDFDMAMEVGYIPDSFGHAAAMPAILRGFGIDNAILYRGFGGEAEHRTSEYRWKSPDGSEVLLVHLHRHGYSGAYFADQTRKEILARFRSLKRDVDARATTPHRLLLNGGDHHWPDASLPAALDLLRLEFDDEMVHGTLPEFIDAVRDSAPPALPLVEGELRSGYKYAFVMHGGVYSSRMYLKQENRSCERLLERYAEPLHAFAVTRGMRPLSHLLRHAWKELLKNHPHDSICGCSVDQVHRDMMTRFAAARAVAQSVVDASLEHLLPRDTGATKDDTQLFFFNPSPRPRSEIVQCEIRLYRQDVVVGLNPDVRVADALPPAGGVALLDADGNDVPLQILDRREDFDITYSEHGYPAQTRADVFTCLVEARDIPAFGYGGLRIKKRDGLPTFPSEIKVRGTTLENGHAHVKVNANGSLDVTDLSSGRTITGLHLFEDGGDAGDEYTYSSPPRDRIVGSKTARRPSPSSSAAAARLPAHLPALQVPAAHPPTRSRSHARPARHRIHHLSRSRIAARVRHDNGCESRRGPPSARALPHRNTHTDCDGGLRLLSRRARVARLRSRRIQHRASAPRRAHAAFRRSRGRRERLHALRGRSARVRVVLRRQGHARAHAAALRRSPRRRRTDHQARRQGRLAQRDARGAVSRYAPFPLRAAAAVTTRVRGGQRRSRAFPCAAAAFHQEEHHPAASLRLPALVVQRHGGAERRQTFRRWSRGDRTLLESFHAAASLRLGNELRTWRSTERATGRNAHIEEKGRRLRY
ncbi:MAG: hypothetical protein IPP94_04265 [Ignavibacteria bacterium]|nr:hypothetical protein [Ignavibacteria bacterium]